MSYQLTWVTSQLAVGYAPMSYDDLEVIKKEGIVAIVNLCAEFTDLHEIEEKAGFEVYYLPTPDEHAPEMMAMEKALEWLDEAIYLGKKVLVHCRHGHGRTGTLVSAYLLRRGLGLKKAGRLLKNTRANPTNYNQWKLLRKYYKKEGELKLSEPKAESQTNGIDLSPFLQEYEAISNKLTRDLAASPPTEECGSTSDKCCREYFTLQLAESIWINNTINRQLSQDDRQHAIEHAGENTQLLKIITRLHRHHPQLVASDFNTTYTIAGGICPLSFDGKCMAYDNRPFRCRWYRSEFARKDKEEYFAMVANISHNMYLALTGGFPPAYELLFSMAETVSGRFVQICFHTMLTNRK
ncbi:MAG: protein tyrosine phosphatase [Desulfobulbus sp.]|nr:MAG: protein tyrosine phosphatase [Desulfobulbus sp.]